MKNSWTPFDAGAALKSLGVASAFKVRAPGHEPAEVTLNQHGQPLLESSGTLLPWDPYEMLLPDAVATTAKEAVAAPKAP